MVLRDWLGRLQPGVKPVQGRAPFTGIARTARVGRDRVYAEGSWDVSAERQQSGGDRSLTVARRSAGSDPLLSSAALTRAAVMQRQLSVAKKP